MISQRASPPPAMEPRLSSGLGIASLALAWAVWLAGAVGAIGLFVLGVRVRLHRLQALSSRSGSALHGDVLGPLTPLIRAAVSSSAYPVVVLTQEILLVTGLTFVGLILAWRKPRQWSALLFSLAMISYGPYITGSLGALLAVHPGWQAPIRIVQTLGIGCAVLSGYLFPDGRFVPRWTRLLTFIWLCWLVGAAVFPSLFLNFSRPYALDATALIALLTWLLSTLAAQGQRYLHASDQVMRRQTKWVLLCMTNTIVTYGIFMLPPALVPALRGQGTPGLLYTLIGYPLFLLSLPVSPVIILIAMMRRHLFDIDTVVNRALVYATLTFTLGLIYSGSILLLEYPLNGLTGGTHLAIIGSTLTTAAVFQPLRRRIQQVIDRRFYRRKYDAAKTLEALRATLHHDVDLQQVCERVIGLVEEAMQPAHVSLWLPPPGWQKPSGEEDDSGGR